jgi:uncharacterized protein (DUF1697 family)
MNSFSQYVAFLRGINVGGNSLIKMADLKKAFEKMGFTDVRTVLASGNVLFTPEQTDKTALARAIESGLKKALGKDIHAMVRSIDDIRKLRSLEPFKEIKVTPSIRLYVTFLPGKTGPRSIKIPFISPQKDFYILRATPAEVFSVLDLAKGKGTPEAMNILEREFGTNITTRNWNTVLKIAT